MYYIQWLYEHSVCSVFVSVNRIFWIFWVCFLVDYPCKIEKSFRLFSRDIERDDLRKRGKKSGDTVPLSIGFWACELINLYPTWCYQVMDAVSWNTRKKMVDIQGTILPRSGLHNLDFRDIPPGGKLSEWGKWVENIHVFLQELNEMLN